jgi:hypothetical protein
MDRADKPRGAGARNPRQRQRLRQRRQQAGGRGRPRARAGRGAAAPGFGKLMQFQPRPLIHPGAKMIVVMSAKSACTNVVMWFFHHLGHAGAAADYHRWPHRYRGQVYYRSQLYRDARESDLSGYAVVRVMRDPYERAASSYRHALTTGYANREMVALLGRPNWRVTGFSFSEYIDMLDRCDLRTCDIHHRLQRHPIEDALPVRHVINITTQDLYARLHEVEADLGLPRTDFRAIAWFNRPSHREPPRRESAADAYEERFTQDTARNGPWPPTAALLTPAARKRLAALYAVDLAAYPGSPAP